MASTAWPRVIVHADMDAFYASIEQLDDPSLRGRPLIVGPDSPRGVVLTASYEARPFGVGSAMPMLRAKRLCPHALIVPPRFERYQQVSQLVMGAFANFSPTVEALSLDEAFLDMTGSERLFGSPDSIGRRLKEAVRAATGGLTASVGISATKFVAKVASGAAKPDGLTIVAPAAVRAWLAPRPVSDLWGAGPKTTQKLKRLGLHTIGDVAAADPARLERALGELGRRFRALARGEDARAVQGSRQAVGLSSERTLASDVSSRAELEGYLRGAADSLARRLRRRRLVAHGVRVKLKRSDFTLITRQCRLGAPTDVAAELCAAALPLLRALVDPGPFRLVGLGVYGLESAEQGGEPQLDLPIGAAARSRRLETTLDRLAARFGAGVVQRAADLERDRGVGVASDLDFLDDEDGGAADDARAPPGADD